MNTTDTRHITGASLYEKRKLYIRLLKTGKFATCQDLAEAVGISLSAARRWRKAHETGGLKALRPQVRGRKYGTNHKLPQDQEQQLQKWIIDQTPDQLKLDFALWTRKAIVQLIKEHFHIKMTLQGIGKYLKRWDFTPQKPIRHAYARDEKEVQDWKETIYPGIVKRAKQEKAEISWGDKTGIRSDDAAGRSYPPCRQTPVQRVKGKPEKINMISAITNQGKVRFMFYRDTMDATRLICFMTRLIRDAKRKVYLILDNLRVHHSRYLAPWLKEHKDEIELFYLPSYSPDLNPAERMNSDLKSALSQKPDSRTKEKMEKNALAHMRSVQKRPERIKRFFNDKRIAYASAKYEAA